MENPYITPQGSVFKLPAQQSQTGPSESFSKSFRDMDYDAIADMTPSHMYVREENLFNESVHEVTMGDPNPSPRLGRRLLRRYQDATAQHTCPSSRPDSSAQSWKRIHRHAPAPGAAATSPHDSYASGAPTQMYEEIQLSRNMRALNLPEEERWNIFEDMSSMNATDRNSPFTPPSEQESNFRNRYKPRPPPHALTATNWRSQPHPPRRRRGSFKSRPGPVTQPRRLFHDESSMELDDFTDNIFSESETDIFAPEQRVVVCAVPKAGPAPGARVRFEPSPAAYVSSVPGPSGLQPPPQFSPPFNSPDWSLWGALPAASPAPSPPPPTSAPCWGKGKAIPGKPLRAKRGSHLGHGRVPEAGPTPGTRMRFEPSPATCASPVPGPSGLQPPPQFSPSFNSPDWSLWSALPAASPAPPPPPPTSAPCWGKGKAIPGKPLRAKRGRTPTPTATHLGHGLPFHPTEMRPWTAPSMFSQQDWNTSYLPDNYYPTYCRGPLPKNYEYDEAYL